ncbi:glycosyltransferase [Agrobacterium tumefaciens]|uniref:glycosyltransferase n=1 Tax=Agrobacterium tumefaciens TaxID=358 RepID=UPI00287DD914|nr:glycosyltransferase [Agrobacterium tumefaciens]MDS7594779.1 glycosyltransferase [Agrobacterium tumefaciens]
MSEATPIYYDMTEALLSTSAKRVQYYGIARTVIEIALNMATRTSDVRFVVFSFGKKAFYEVHWHQTASGDIVFDLPKDVGQRWSRSHAGSNILLSLFSRLKNIIADKRNNDLWEKNASALKKIEVDNGIFLSAGRPKLIVDMIKSIRTPGSTAKVVALLHDFMPLHRIGAKRFRRFDRNFLRDNQYVIKNADMLLTNSQFTREELDRFANAGILPKPGPVVTVPLVHECPPGTEKAEISLPAQPYLLTVGLNLGRKNIEIVLEALRRMDQQGSDIPNLAIAGANRKRLKRYVERREFASIRHRITFVNNPNQTDLVRLYENALALVIPSYIEGWGLPAGEALWCGTPAVCSTAEVLREVSGDLGLYFDPDDADALSEIIKKLQGDKAFLTSLKERIAASKPALRTWRIVADEVLRALNEHPATTSVDKQNNPLADQGPTRYEN